MAITSQFLTDFQNSFTAGKRSKLLKQNLYNTSHHTFNMLPQYLAKFEVRICVNLKKNLKIVSHLTKTETSLVIWLNIITYSCSKCPSFALTHAQRRPRHWSIALSMMVRSMSCQRCRKCCFSSQHLFR